MRKGLRLIVMLTALGLAPAALGHAQATSPAVPAAKPAVKASAPAASGRAGAAEARYRAWVDREHAEDAAVFQVEKSKIEDKYKGYVRPRHDKKGAKPRKAPKKSNE